MKKTTAAEIARKTLQILEAGNYTNSAGEKIDISGLVACSVRGTCSYPPDVALPGVPHEVHKTQFRVANESTASAARRLADDGKRPVALNFASARHPGGGFLTGARAQEESLARASALYACINGNPMYEFHQNCDAMYSDYAIYSPDVPIFRDDEGALLTKPYLCSFITAPAVNAKVVLQRDSGRRQEIRDAMNRRVRKVLAIAAAQRHEELVLGAWGCGVFGNNCQEIAQLFQIALDSTFRGVFALVVFAVLDSSQEGRFIGPFESLFASSR